ncbi:hypothetical protein [uncultured Vagococcus sp.]|uniref:hypothetical protein n=1 Tax=uncultured Vagococcus sp. TaxID=189676 RepID=UPI0028D5CB86|nr:hypothetical protein [uncultured Vagococcus sp.]
MLQLIRSFNYFTYLKVMLLVIPVFYGAYASLSALKANLSLMTYIGTQPAATVMLLVSCLSLFWYLLYQRHYGEGNQGGDLRKSLMIYLLASVLVGNIVGAGLGIMTIRQVPKASEKAKIKDFWFEWLLLGMSLFCSFALVRITLG